MTQSTPYIIKEIPLADIIFPQEEMRSQISFEGLDELSMSIRQLGLMNPISVRPKGDKFELIAGYRRTKACEMAGMPAVPARVFESSDDIADLQKAHENIFREEVNALDEGNYFKILLEKHSWKLSDLALAIHKSTSYVSRRVSLGECPDDVKQALKDGKINLSIAEELTKVKDSGSRSRLLFLVIQNGASVDVVRQWRIQYEMEQNYKRPAAYVEGQKDENGNVIDTTKPFDLAQDPGPQYSLEEKVNVFRVCHSCLNKTAETEAKLLVLCPTCAKAIESFLPGGTPK
jgi:ParB family chromosome partitioning protein